MPDHTDTTKTAILERSNYIKNYLITFFTDIGKLWQFFIRFWRELFSRSFEWKELLNQSYLTGFKSLSLVGFTGFIMGLVLTIQSKPTLSEFGAEAWLPGMVAISLVREIGPVVTALICAGKIGSGIGAELGSMRVTEQIDAMDVSGSNPYRYLVVTRVLATTIMVPILVLYADAIGLLGSYVGVNIDTKVSYILYMNRAMSSLEFSDLAPATIKSVVFGFIIGIVGCYKGFNAGNGTASVGKAANEAVVTASLLIFIANVIAVQLTAIFVFNTP